MTSKMLDLSSELYDRLYNAFLNCEAFDSDLSLQTLVAEGELAVYHPWFLKQQFATKEERVRRTIAYLRRQRIKGVKPVLPLFLLRLSAHAHLIVGDMLYDELEDLCREVEGELGTQTSDERNEVQSHQNHTSASASVMTIEQREMFLSSIDREWMIERVDYVIGPMQSEGRKNLLRACSFNDATINRVSFDAGSRNVAEAMVGLVAGQVKLEKSLRCLKAFLDNLVEQNFSEDDASMRKEVADLLQRSQLSQQEYPLVEKRQDARGQKSPLQTSPQYKLDASTLTQCNLDEQRILFWNGFARRYIGTFIFTVASVERRILEEYVIEGLLSDFKQRTKRPVADLRHFHLRAEYLDLSSPERGASSLEQELKRQLLGQSLIDLLSDNPEAHLVIVLWLLDPIPQDRFRHIALHFSEKLKELANRILEPQDRCLVLFWASYGFPRTDPLNIPVALPAFEQFEVDPLIDWLRIELRSQLRCQNVAEQDIVSCQKWFAERVRLLGGRLPETYEILRGDLKRGAVF